MFDRLHCKARPARVPSASRPDGGYLRLARAAVGAALIATASTATAQQVRITGLADVNFGTVNNLAADAINTQSICVWANGSNSDYSITATGSGVGGAFSLANGSFELPYQVRWNSQPGQANGALLTSGMPLTGQVTAAQNQTCANGPPTTASLIVVLPAASLSSAIAGNYNGTLTLIVASQ